MKLTELRQIIREEISKTLNESEDNNFENFLYKFAEDNFGFDPDGEPAYYVDYHHGVLGMGTFFNPKFQSSNALNLDKEEVKNSMTELAQELIHDIKEKFNKEFYIEYIITNDKKHGFILREE